MNGEIKVALERLEAVFQEIGDVSKAVLGSNLGSDTYIALGMEAGAVMNAKALLGRDIEDRA